MFLCYFEDCNELFIGILFLGFVVFNFDDWFVCCFEYDENDLQFILVDLVVMIFCCWDGFLWFGLFYGGISCFDLDVGIFMCFLLDFEWEGMLSSCQVVVFFEDYFGCMWVGIYGDGINLFDDVFLMF